MSEEKKANIETTEKKEEQKKSLFTRFLRTFLKVCLIAIALLFILSLSFIGLSQTEGFRHWLSGYLLELVNNELEGKLEFTDVILNPFKGGLEVKNVCLTAAGDTVVFCKDVVVNFDIRPLFSEKAIVNYIYLESPRIKLIRNQEDSTWNFEHIAKPIEDTTISKTDWVVEVNRLTINNAKLKVYDGTTNHVSTGNVDYGNMNLENLNLKLNCLLKLGEPSFAAKIESLKFRDRNSGIIVRNMYLDAVADTSKLEINVLNLYTGSNSITMSAKLDKINVFSVQTEPDFNNSPLTLKLKADPVNADELIRLVPIPVKLAEDYALDLEANGSMNNLNIKKLKLEFNNSELNLTGRLKNLTEPEKYDYLVKIDETNIDYNGIMRRLPFIDPVTIPDFGSISLNNTEVHGRKDSISLTLDAVSSFGKVTGQAGVGFRNRLTFSGNLKTENFNLSNILRNPEFTSSLNSTIDFAGAGTDIKDMTLILGISSANSRLMSYNFNDMNLSARIDGRGTIYMDTLRFLLNNKPVIDTLNPDLEDKAKLSLSGRLNIADFNKPVYALNLSFTGLNSASLSKNSYAPEYISGEITLNGEGFDPDSLNTIMNVKINDCAFRDRALNPFTLNVNASRSSGARALFIKSDFLNVTLSGDYTYKNLFNISAVHGLTIADFVLSKVNIMNRDNNSNDSTGITLPKLSSFEPMNLKFHSEIRDLSLLAVFLKDMKLHSESTIDMSWETRSQSSRLSIDSIRINNFEIDAPSFEISSRPLLFKGIIDMNLKDSLPSLSNINLDFIASSDILVNDIVLNEPYASVNYKDNSTDFTISSDINNIIKVYNNGKIQINETGYEIAIDSSRYVFQDSIIWSSPDKININIDNNGIDIKSFLLKRTNSESISLTGIYSDKGSNLNLFVKNFKLPDIALFMPHERWKQFSTLKGNIDSLTLNFKGKIENPDLTMNLYTSYINYNGTYIGDLSGILHHSDSLVTGNIEISNILSSDPRKILSIDILSLPLNLSSNPVKNRIQKSSEFNILMKSYDLPLELASPFIPALDSLRGMADATLKVSGYAPDDINLTGNIQYKNTTFTVHATNMKYMSKGKIELEPNMLLLKNMELFNLQEDMNNGKALINGEVELKNFEPGDLNIHITSAGIKVLNQSSVKAMPNLYGDFIISTGPEPITFFGTLDEPCLQGDVNVLRANLTMPNTNATQIRKSAFRYEEKNNYLKIIALWDSLKQTTAQTPETITRTSGTKKEISDLIDYDLNIRIKGSFIVNMEMGFQQALFAEIGVKDQSQPLRFVLKRGSNEPKFYGDILVKEGSTLKFYKQFNTMGSISFPTGAVTNPGLDLVAEYKGTTTISNEPRDYKVILYVTGTKEKPLIRFSYSINEHEAVGDTSKIREDAIFMLLFGKTKDEYFGSSSGGGFINLDIGSSASSAASSFLTQALQGTGVIQSADIDFSKGSWEQATLKLTAQFLGTKWKVGGNVGDFSNNYEVSIEYPLPLLLDPVIQLTRSLGTTNLTTKNQKVFEIKFKIGNSW
ncbi:MAG: translocation/assembly module TamB domain-containing protein [Bacteroidetes bacterium]|nr:translocation/assembly module TamB domain-containing protein [Bacteroidota bacterium]